MTINYDGVSFLFLIRNDDQIYLNIETSKTVVLVGFIGGRGGGGVRNS